MSANIDKMSIVIKNYFSAECDVDTTIRQAYERGFRRGASKCDVLNMHIRELSDGCDKLNDENAGMKRRLERAEQLLGKREYDIGKLHELVSQLQTDLESEFDDAEQMEAKEEMYKAENEKLREIVRDMRKAFFTLDIDHCQACPRDTINGPCTKYLISGSDECNFEEEMRELGIEVDE